MALACVDHLAQAQLLHLVSFKGDGAADGCNGHAGLLRTRGHAAHGFAVQGLMVEPSFTRHNEVCSCEGGVEARQIQQLVDAGSYARAEKHRKSHAQATSRAVARGVETGVGMVGADDVGEMPHARFKGFEHRAVRAFLAAEHVRGAMGPQKRVVHVAQDRDRRVSHPRMQAALVYARNGCQIATASGQLSARIVEQPNAERAQTAHSTVVRARSAQPDDDVCASSVESEADAFPHTEARGGKRVALIAFQKRQAAGRGGFDIGDAVVDEDRALAGAHQAVVCGKGDSLAGQRAGDGVECALAAIGNGIRDARGAGKRLLRGLVQQLGDLRARKRSLERV